MSSVIEMIEGLGRSVLSALARLGLAGRFFLAIMMVIAENRCLKCFCMVASVILGLRIISIKEHVTVAADMWGWTRPGAHLPK